MKIAKILTMGGMAIIFWVLAWILIRAQIYQNLQLLPLVWPALLVVFGIIFTTFFFLINKNQIISLVVDAIIVGSYLLIMPKDAYVLLAGGIFLVSLILFEHRVHEETKSRLNFSIRSLISTSISITTYALLLLIAFNVYHSISVDFKNNSQAYYEKLANVTADTVPYVIQNSDPTLSAIIAQSAVSRVQQLASGYEQYVPITFAIVVTGLLWTFAFLIRWAASALGWILFQMLVWMKFFKLGHEMVEIESVEI